MRRRHNVIAATFLLLGVIFLCAQREGDLLDRVSSHGHESELASDRTNLHGADGVHTESKHIPQSATALRPHPSAFIDLDGSDRISAGYPSAEALPPLEEGRLPQDGSKLPSSDSPQPSFEANSVEPPSEPEYAFQKDLDLDLPVSILQQVSSYAPHNYDSSGSKTYAFATFMATRNPSLRDPYLLAIHSLIYRVLWSAHLRTQKNYPFIVFVADFVTQEQRQLLAGAGAVVRELKPLEWHCDADGLQKRWNDLFAKLNMWAETEFERIHFLDADAFPLTNIDGVFDIAPMQKCIEEKLKLDDFLPDRTPVCEPYIFTGVPQDPFNPKNVGLNVGSMVFTPSLRMHQRLVQNYRKTDHYDCAMAEQAFLNWQFGPEGAYPPTKLDRVWGGFFPTADDEGKLKVVHQKIWAEEEGWMNKEWKSGWEEMSQWYGSEEFVERRKQGGV